MKQDLYVIQKLVKARSAEDAIKKEKRYKVESVWIDADWKTQKIQETNKVGFKL